MPSWIPGLSGAPATVITANRNTPPAIGKHNAIGYNTHKASGLLDCLLKETTAIHPYQRSSFGTSESAQLASLIGL